jgi:hypothetical protein
LFFASALLANFDDADLDLTKDPYSIRMEQEAKAIFSTLDSGDIKQLGGTTTAPTPTKSLTKSNYMDYFIERKMFFKTQVQTIINNLKKGE